MTSNKQFMYDIVATTGGHALPVGTAKFQNWFKKKKNGHLFFDISSHGIQKSVHPPLLSSPPISFKYNE